MSTPDGVLRFRQHFPIFKQKTYLNSCSKGALSEEVKSAIDEFMEEWATTGSAWEAWGARVQQAREAFARLIHADADEIAVTFSASSGMNSLLSALTYSDRPKIVTTPFEFPTVRYICQTQQELKAQVEDIAVRANELRLEDYETAIDDHTRLVTATLICYQNGFATKWLAPLAQATHARGAWLLLDAYQGLGAEPVDVRETDIDFLVSGSLKYLLGLQGAAFVYVRRDLIERLRPRDTGWQAHGLAFGSPRLEHAPDARRFQTGTQAHLSVYAALAGLQLIQSVGVPTIAAWLTTLTQRLIDGARHLGADVLTPADPAKRGPMVAIRARQVEALVEALGREDIVTSHRGALRVSLHYYNTEEDVDRLLQALTRHRQLLLA
ncbi:MAG: aminotransferase class V-fold PLP-dependent enzyme [Chloroflexota bacterium]